MPEVGESITKDVELKPELVMEVLIGINNFLWILTPLFIFIGAFGVYRTYRKNGLDKYRKNVIIPLFSPRINFHVALTNSIIKERFDNRDLSASIIKLAVEGYINIERKDNVLKLIRTDKPLESLKDEIDTIILTNFFSKSNEVNVTVPPIELRNSIKKIQAAIEKTVNQQGYFISNPRVQFAKYLAIGSVFTIFSGILLIMTGIALTKLIGYISTFHLAIIPLVYGIGILLISKHMPSKSEEGSRIEAELLGFKMYLFTAERFRLEDQKIDEFEQYLAYAIALGVEKAWADRFADLGDKIVIDWYQGDPFTISEVYLLRKSLDISFRRILDYSSQSSVKVSGWSSGTSFGGFSGGGGGGRSGAW